MIYITGDCHCDFKRFGIEEFPEQGLMRKQDYVIICGDFGLWDKTKQSVAERTILTSRSFTTLWIDGNHENFDLLKEYPVEDWNGGKIHRITSSIIHLIRGQVYTINGYKFFTFGGARSHDIADGILERDDPDLREKVAAMRRENKLFRVNHLSWWEEEMASQKEKEEGFKNLEKNDWKVKLANGIVTGHKKLWAQYMHFLYSGFYMLIIIATS